jgi:hypothetical protein
MGNVFLGLAFIFSITGAAAQSASAPGPIASTPRQAPIAPGAAVSWPQLSGFASTLETARSAPTISTVLGDVVGNPIVGPVLVAAAAYFGVPPNVVAGIAGLAAAGQAQNSAQRHGRQDVYEIRPPSGYELCAVRLSAISVRPKRDKRPRVIVTASPESFRFEVNHQIQNIGEGGSKVKVRVDFATVLKGSTAATEQAGKCFPAAKTSTVIATCRGSECDRVMTGSTWFSGH